MKNRLVAYEGLRFIFIIFMVLHHLDTFNDISIPSFTENIKKFCVEGFIGVNFFFMLSGIGCVLGYKNRLETKQITCKQFLLTRFIKIYPAYLFFLIIGVFLYYGGRFGKAKEFIMYLLMCQSFPLSQNMAFGYNGVAWCVSDLAFFYLIFCVIYKICLKECIYSILVLSLFILTNILYHSGDGNVMTAIFYINPIFRLLDFLVGMALGLYFTNHKIRGSSLLQLFSIAVLFGFLLIGAYGNVPWLYKWGLFYIIPCALMLFAFYPETVLSKKVFECKYWKNLSAASFVIYLSHQEILNAVRMYMPEKVSVYFYKYFMPYGIVSCVFFITIFSVLLSELFIKPTTKWLLSKQEKRK